MKWGFKNISVAHQVAELLIQADDCNVAGRGPRSFYIGCLLISDEGKRIMQHLMDETTDQFDGPSLPVCDPLIESGFEIRYEKAGSYYNLYALPPADMPDEEFILMRMRYGK